MANSGKRNTNTSQFFFTLDKADELTNKHTMFGKVVGNTIYSMSSIVHSYCHEKDVADDRFNGSHTIRRR
jgi:cyclophilin family peptidyl-prolyl cis-trans isomerase